MDNWAKEIAEDIFLNQLLPCEIEPMLRNIRNEAFMDGCLACLEDLEKNKIISFKPGKKKELISKFQDDWAKEMEL